MAKLGNEARLVLKLVGERLVRENKRIRADTNYSEPYKTGFESCASWVEIEFRNVQLELETK